MQHYYVVRNAGAISLWSKLKWKARIAFNSIRRFCLYAIFMPTPLLHLKFMLIGAWHGLLGKSDEFAGLSKIT